MIYINNTNAPIMYFPNKEIYLDTTSLSQIPRENELEIQLKFAGNDDLVALMLLCGQLRDMGFCNLVLKIPYFPYSTMDHTDGTRPLSLKYIAQFINSLNFKHVEVWEEHSSTLRALLDRGVFIDTTVRIARDVLSQIPQQDTLICFPDSGATKRYESAFKGYRTATFYKQRDFATGNIVSMACLDSLDNLTAGTVAVIVDDLCRGGATFHGCAEVLKNNDIDKVVLVVTHTEDIVFSGKMLKEGLVDTVYTTDSLLISGERHEKIIIKNMDKGL